MYDYQLTTLPNGVRIASERMPGVRSAALGIWVTTGSREEKASESGAAHFIEHMLFNHHFHHMLSFILPWMCKNNDTATRMEKISDCFCIHITVWKFMWTSGTK